MKRIVIILALLSFCSLCFGSDYPDAVIGKIGINQDYPDLVFIHIQGCDASWSFVMNISDIDSNETKKAMLSAIFLANTTKCLIRLKGKGTFADFNGIETLTYVELS